MNDENDSSKEQFTVLQKDIDLQEKIKYIYIYVAVIEVNVRKV